ncbi:MAG: YciI family protein [Bradyrhizobium sp.]
MRFMVIVKATKDTEAGILPSTEEFAAMGRFNEELVKAGMMEAGEGLHPTAKGARIDFSDGQAHVARGPFDFSGDLAAGFWMIKAGSLGEVIEHMQRAPFLSGQIEIRQVYAAEDFGETFAPELRERVERLRAQAAKS